MATNTLPEGSTWKRFILENVTENQEIRVTFAPDVNNDGIPDKYQTVVVSSSVDGSGSVDPSKKEIALGDSIVFTVTPGEGQALYQVKNGDEVLYTNASETPFSGTFTVQNVVSDMEITFVFSVDTDGDGIPDASETWYTIKLNHDANTTIASNGQQDSIRVKVGQDCPIQFSANSGYAIDTVSIDDQSFINNGQSTPPNGTSWDGVTLTNVQKDHTVSVTGAETTDATGVPDKYKFTVTPIVVGESGGEVSLDPQLVVYGQNVVANISPNEGMSVDSIQTSANTYVNNPNFGKAVIDDMSQLTEAISDPDISQLSLNASLDTDNELTINRPITLDGNGNTITKSSEGKILNLTADSTIENVNLDSTADNTDWKSSYGIQFYTGDHTIRNAKISGGNAGIIVNSANVTLEGNIDVSGNTFGGIEVSKGSAEGLNGGVLNINGANITNTTEEYGKPTIWIDGNTDDIGVVNGADSFTMIQVPHGDYLQKQFYLNEVNSKPVLVGGTTSYGTIADAIASSNGQLIQLKSDISEASIPVPAGSKVSIDGEGHTITGCFNLESESTPATVGSFTVSNAVFDGDSSIAWALNLQNQTETAGQSSFDIEFESCQFRNLTKKAMYITEAASLTLLNCTFENCATDEMNTPNTYGDYVVDCNLVGVKDATILIDGCTFTNNKAQKASIKVTQRGGESDEGASDIPQGVTATVASFEVTDCTFSDTEPASDIAIGSDNKSASTNPDAVNTTGDFGQVSIHDNLTDITISTPYDGETYQVAAGKSFTKTGSGDPVVS